MSLASRLLLTDCAGASAGADTLYDIRRSNLLGGLIAGALVFFLVYWQTLDLFSIDDLSALTPGPTKDLFVNNLVPKGRYITFLAAELFEMIGINLYASYTLMLLGTQLLIGGMVAAFATLYRIKVPILVGLLCVLISLSPQNFELMHFRHGILIDATTYGGAWLLIFLYDRRVAWPYLGLPAILMLGGYTSSIPLLLSLIAVFLLIDLICNRRKLIQAVIIYSAVVLGSFGLHYVITTGLTSLYGQTSSQGLALTADALKKTWDVNLRSTKWVMLNTTYSIIPSWVHLAVTALGVIAFTFAVKTWAFRGLIIGFGVLILLTNFLNVFILPFEIKYLPGRAHLHIQIIVALFILVGVAATWKKSSTYIAAMLTTSLGVIVFTTSALDHSNGIRAIRENDTIIAQDLISTVSEYDTPPVIYVVYDGSSVRQRDKQAGVYGDFKSLFYAAWSRYKFLQRSGLPDVVKIDTNTARTESFNTACRARRNEDFSHSIVKGEDFVHLCM